jgi:signal transduction histidine kinase
LRTNRLLKEQNDQINIANKKLQKSEKNLKLINATKDKFFSIISHDLKNPFTSLLSISETMHDNYEAFDEEEKKTSVGRIHGSIKHIYTLLENLLTWSRTQTGTIQFDPGEFNLSRLMEENFLLYEHIAAKKDIKLTLSAPEDITVYADRNMINTAVRNLLNNSIKFTGPGKSIEIGINEHPQETEVFVSDTGVGISEEAQQKLFRIDQKVKTTGTDGEKGTGLGLIICKEFVVKNGGSIGVESKPGSGSRFRFTIPKTGVGSRESEVGSR